MRWILPSGRKVWKNIDRFRVDWDKPCRSKIQFKFKKFIQPFIEKHLILEEFVLPHSRMSVDLMDLTSKKAYEIQGKQHHEYNDFFAKGSRSNYLGQIHRDSKKRDWLENNNFELIEIKEDEIPKLSKDWFEEKFKIKL